MVYCNRFASVVNIVVIQVNATGEDAAGPALLPADWSDRSSPDVARRCASIDDVGTMASVDTSSVVRCNNLGYITFEREAAF